MGSELVPLPFSNRDTCSGRVMHTITQCWDDINVKAPFAQARSSDTDTTVKSVSDEHAYQSSLSLQCIGTPSAIPKNHTSGNLPLTFLHSYELVRARTSEKVDKSTSNLESKKS